MPLGGLAKGLAEMRSWSSFEDSPQALQGALDASTPTEGLQWYFYENSYRYRGRCT